MRSRRMFILSPLRVTAFLHSLGQKRHFASQKNRGDFGLLVSCSGVVAGENGFDQCEIFRVMGKCRFFDEHPNSNACRAAEPRTAFEPRHWLSESLRYQA